MKTKIQNPIQPDWRLKIFAGGVLGLSLTIALANLMVLCGRAFIRIEILAQFAMWSVPFIWLPIFFVSFYIAKGKTAVCALFALNVLAYTTLLLFRS